MTIIYEDKHFKEGGIRTARVGEVGLTGFFLRGILLLKEEGVKTFHGSKV